MMPYIECKHECKVVISKCFVLCFLRKTQKKFAFVFVIVEKLNPAICSRTQNLSHCDISKRADCCVYHYILFYCFFSLYASIVSHRNTRLLLDCCC